jgi:hypothetical protein
MVSSTQSIPTVIDPSARLTYQGHLSNHVEKFMNVSFGQATSGQARFAPSKPFKYTPNVLVNASIPRLHVLRQKLHFLEPQSSTTSHVSQKTVSACALVSWRIRRRRVACPLWFTSMVEDLPEARPMYQLRSHQIHPRGDVK